jgi:predicted nucleic acid-binding Zn ribbon protein
MPKQKKGELVRAERIIGAIKDASGLHTKDIEFEALRHWEKIVGDRIAAHTKPLYITEGALYVLAEGSVWCQEVSYIKNRIVKELNELMGMDIVKDIRYRVEGLD